MMAGNVVYLGRVSQMAVAIVNLFRAVPQQLKDFPHWIVWKLESGTAKPPSSL